MTAEERVDQLETLLPLICALFQSGYRKGHRTSDGTYFETIHYNPHRMEELKNRFFQIVPLDEAREIYLRYLKQPKPH